MIVRFIVVFLLILPLAVSAQKKKKSAQKTPVAQKQAAMVKDQFPIQKMWDEAIGAAKKSGRPVLAFNVDFVDSTSIAFRDGILRNPKVREYLNKTFELAVNDYSVDPPPSVGFDSLRNLGRRLDGLERGFLIAVRPTAIIIRPDTTEIERISHPEQLTPEQFIARLQNYLSGIGTTADLRKKFWSDTTNRAARVNYLEKLVERSEYDSTVRHLSAIAEDEKFPDLAKASRKQLAYMRTETERRPKYIVDWLGTLSRSREDSLDAVEGMYYVLGVYQSMKRVDSISVWYEQLMGYIGERDPDLLNNYAWDVVSFSAQYDTALALVNQAIAKKPRDPNYYDTRALIYSYKKEYDAAIADAEKALQLGSAEHEYYQDRIDFYKQQKQESLNPTDESEE